VSATYGPAKQNYPAGSPFTNCSNCMYGPPNGVVCHESAFLATSCIAYLWGTAYEKPHCAINRASKPEPRIRSAGAAHCAWSRGRSSNWKSGAGVQFIMWDRSRIY